MVSCLLCLFVGKREIINKQRHATKFTTCIDRVASCSSQEIKDEQWQVRVLFFGEVSDRQLRTPERHTLRESGECLQTSEGHAVRESGEFLRTPEGHAVRESGEFLRTPERHTLRESGECLRTPERHTVRESGGGDGKRLFHETSTASERVSGPDFKLASLGPLRFRQRRTLVSLA